MRIIRARRGKLILLAYKGAHSYEAQIGRTVFQVRHRGWRDAGFTNIKRVNVWRDAA